MRSAVPPADLRNALRAALPNLPRRPWVPLPGGRVNRVWRVGSVVVKAHAAGADSPLFPNDPAAEADALQLLGPLGLSPVLLATGPGWIAWRFVPGSAWRGGVERAAACLAAIHALAPPPGLRRAPMGSAAIRAHGAGFAGDLPAPPDPGVPPPARPRLVHGDAVPGNLIATPAGAVVAIDWQCPAAGDPADDLSLFLSPAMQRLYRGAPLSAGERARFLAAYPDRTTVERFLALEPLLAWRIAAHCRWRARRGEADYARVAEAG